MNLELLPNELLINLFEYLSISDLFRAFSDVNSRFNTLISIFIRCSQHLDCRSMSKNQFDFFYQQHLPSITNRIISLSLSNNDETPQQINRFFSHDFKLNQFIHLRSLSFYHLCSEEIMKKIMMTWHDLSYLSHLKFSECHLRYNDKDALQLMNSIWSLSKLTHCYLDIGFRWRSTFIAPTVISSSIESLIIPGIYCEVHELTHLFQHTIRIRHLCVNVNTLTGHAVLPLTVTSMISLKLKFSSSLDGIDVINSILENMQNLRRLTIETLNVFVDGDQWRGIIKNYLPKLKIFRLKMEFYFRDRINTKKYVDRLLNSFQTCFWLEERQWFVRCHYHPQSSSNYVCFYTLPYNFISFPRIEVSGCQSTCSVDDNHSWSYDNVRTLNYGIPLTEDLILYQCRFINIQHLSLSLGVNDHFWTIVPKFICLISLDVSLCGRIHNVQSQLQTILDQAPHLNLLKFSSWRTLEVPIAEISSSSVRQLDLRDSDRWYNDLECLTLINSPLGIQCEFLRINVINRMSISDLVTKMANLRALNVRCEGDTFSEHPSTSSDELVNWLQYNVFSTCTITRRSRYIADILIWIR